MKALWNWLSGWIETIEIRIRKPKLYKLLTDDDFHWENDDA